MVFSSHEHISVVCKSFLIDRGLYFSFFSFSVYLCKCVCVRLIAPRSVCCFECMCMWHVPPWCLSETQWSNKEFNKFTNEEVTSLEGHTERRRSPKVAGKTPTFTWILRCHSRSFVYLKPSDSHSAETLEDPPATSVHLKSMAGDSVRINSAT